MNKRMPCISERSNFKFGEVPMAKSAFPSLYISVILPVPLKAWNQLKLCNNAYTVILTIAVSKISKYNILWSLNHSYASPDDAAFARFRDADYRISPLITAVRLLSDKLEITRPDSSL